MSMSMQRMPTGFALLVLGVAALFAASLIGAVAVAIALVVL